ncbi:MAG: DUF4878 domain-containing protein [Mycobacterium sp.]|nr:DUF4878 domain-containing protein [Mycobacterium sp.]
MSGIDPADLGEAPGADDSKPIDDSDPITEVIDIPVGELGDPGTGARRYTAPGFDAGSTQIIDRVPDDSGSPTEVITRGFHRRPAPRAIPGHRRRRPIWRLVIGVLVAVLLVAGVVGGVMYKRHAERAAQQQAVRSAIETFDSAVRNGDLATLRDVTCGQLHDNYVKYDDSTWTDTYSKIMAAKQYPVVASVDQVVVNGTHAEANVSSYMAFEPTTTSTRSFDLQLRDNQWKICQSS